MKIKVSATVTLILAKVSAKAISPGFFPNEGIKISKRITTKSWNSNTPMTFLPCSVSNSPLSDNALITIAVDDIATAPPKAQRTCQGIGKGIKNRNKYPAGIVSNIVKNT